jgi:hypothetical protein
MLIIIETIAYGIPIRISVKNLPVQESKGKISIYNKLYKIKIIPHRKTALPCQVRAQKHIVN